MVVFCRPGYLDHTDIDNTEKRHVKSISAIEPLNNAKKRAVKGEENDTLKECPKRDGTGRDEKQGKKMQALMGRREERRSRERKRRRKRRRRRRSEKHRFIIGVSPENLRGKEKKKKKKKERPKVQRTRQERTLNSHHHNNNTIQCAVCVCVLHLS